MGKEQLPGMRAWKEYKLLQQVPGKCCTHMCISIRGDDEDDDVCVCIYGCMLGQEHKERHSIQTVGLVTGPISLHTADDQSQTRDTKPKVLSEQALHQRGMKPL